MQLGLGLLVIALIVVSTVLVVGVIATATAKVRAGAVWLSGLTRSLEEARPAWREHVGEARRRLLEGGERVTTVGAALEHTKARRRTTPG